jgi:uncharacterized protein YjbJ (UPF0337 family)
MSEGARDRIEGKADEITGRGKTAFGDLTGDEQTRAEGDAQETQGHLQQATGDVKDAVGDAKDKLGDAMRNLKGDDR